LIQSKPKPLLKLKAIVLFAHLRFYSSVDERRRSWNVIFNGPVGRLCVKYVHTRQPTLARQ